MQERTRVFVIGDNLQEARRLGEIFTRSAAFVVTGFGTFSSVPQFDANRSDVVVVKSGNSRAALHLGTLLAMSRGRLQAPTLWLGPSKHRSSEDRHTRTEDAELPTDATPSQIRAAAAALAAGLHVGSLSSGRPQTEDEFEFVLLDPLTEREIEVLNLVAEGFSNPEIAKRLGVSRNTVKFHVSSIIGKLGATSRTEAVTLGLKRGLIII